ncbi:THUMP domain-containing protein 1 [Smittium mucronatum]|uniref:THUMP domain-containing protein 1 n=1 Tax=Smittium mucronatum TaxID=133383 RepID=A0A1R0GXF3_9FUNG|nr:THUMP domain-containing protein 1 [Smittium mucronatum]
MLVKDIMQDIGETKKKDTRFTNRLIPFHDVCSVSSGDIDNAIKSAGKEYLKDGSQAAGQKFMGVVKIRNNNTVNKESIINSIGDIFTKNHTVDLNDPDFTIIVEVFRNVCIVSVLTDYIKLRKFNIFGLFSGGFAEPKKSIHKDP